MYRVSPFTYLVSGIMSTALHNVPVVCSSIEFLRFDPINGQTCGAYMSDYIKTAGGYIVDPDATSGCAFCPLANTDAFLKLVNSDYGDRWRNFGILWVYIVVNVFGALFFYWLVRVPKKGKKTQVKAGEVGAPVQARVHDPIHAAIHAAVRAAIDPAHTPVNDPANAPVHEHVEDREKESEVSADVQEKVSSSGEKSRDDSQA